MNLVESPSKKSEDIRVLDSNFNLSKRNVSPSSFDLVVDKNDQHNIFQQGLLAYKIYALAVEEYEKALNNPAPLPISTMCEFGLKNEFVQIQRITTSRKTMPLSSRLDLCGPLSELKIAEVQWKSGGFGFFVSLYSQLSNPGDREELYDLLKTVLFKDVDYAVSVGSNEWCLGEELFKELIRPFCSYKYISYENFDQLMLRDAKLIFGQGFYLNLPENALTDLLKRVLKGDTWVECPMNNLFAQKWPLALPFMPEYYLFFSDEERHLLATSRLIFYDSTIGSIKIHPSIATSSSVFNILVNLADITLLSRSQKRSLVFKCASGVDKFSSRGYGVFRLGYSEKIDHFNIEFMKSRVRQGEPWIMQEFISSDKFGTVIDSTFTSNEKFKLTPFLVYDNLSPRILFSLGYSSKHWKITGSGSKGVKVNLHSVQKAL